MKIATWGDERCTKYQVSGVQVFAAHKYAILHTTLATHIQQFYREALTRSPTKRAGIKTWDK
jgi:hypothetical protein